MKIIPESNNLKNYLLEDENVDYSHPAIRKKVIELYYDCDDELDRAKKTFEFVRDHIAHSWDAQSTSITRKASEVLIHKEGICYAKSNLFAALLRAISIPAGFCYQRLTLGDEPETGYCIHALNAVFLSKINRWIRLDTRGNKDNINAEFSTDDERLAFPVRKHYDEKDYPTIYVRPLKITMDTLKNNENCLEMYQYHLPAEL